MDSRKLLPANVLGLMASVMLAVTAIGQGAIWDRTGAGTAGARPAQATAPNPTVIPGDARVSGRVTAHDNGAAIAGADLSIQGCDGFTADTTSDANGDYALDIPKSSLDSSVGYTVSVSAPGYEPEQRSADVMVIQGRLGDFALWSESAPQPTAWHGHFPVRIEVRGEVPENRPMPLAGARIVGLHCRCYEYPNLVTGADGLASMTVAADPAGGNGCGAIRFRVRAAGYVQIEGVKSGGYPWHGSFVLTPAFAPNSLHLPRVSAGP